MRTKEKELQDKIDFIDYERSFPLEAMNGAIVDLNVAIRELVGRRANLIERRDGLEVQLKGVK